MSIIPTLLNEKEALAYCEKTIELKQKLELGWVALAERLINIKNNNIADIGQYGSFSLFLDEIKIKPSTAEHLMRGYRKFVIEWNIEPKLLAEAGGYSRVYEAIPLINNETEAREALNALQAAPNKGKVKEYVELALTGKTTPQTKPKCQHETTYTAIICTCCNKIITTIE